MAEESMSSNVYVVGPEGLRTIADEVEEMVARTGGGQWGVEVRMTNLIAPAPGVNGPGGATGSAESPGATTEVDR